MQVELISYTHEPIKSMYLAAKRCVTFGDVLNRTEDDYETQKRVVGNCLNAGHPVGEFVDFTFSIQGISDPCSKQLLRHRVASAMELSERHVQIGTPEEAEKVEQYLKEEIPRFRVDDIIYKYFERKPAHYDDYARDFVAYHKHIKEGEPIEEARKVLPKATLTSLIWKCNFRELVHFCNLRMCSKAQKEIRELANKMSLQIFKLGNDLNSVDGNFLARWLVPKCYALGRCDEKNGCGHYERMKEENH